MNAPRYAERAAAVLAHVPLDGHEPSPERRRELVEAMTRAVEHRGHRRRRLQGMAIVVATTAVAIVATLGWRALHADRPPSPRAPEPVVRR